MSYGHAQSILNALDRHPCGYCGRPVGREARGSSQCVACIRRQIELEANGMPTEQAERVLELEGRGHQIP